MEENFKKKKIEVQCAHQIQRKERVGCGKEKDLFLRGIRAHEKYQLF